MKRRLKGGFAHQPIVEDDYLIGMIVFELAPGKVESIECVTLNGVALSDDEYTAYNGEQKKADSILLDKIPGFTKDHIAFEVAYLAIKVKYRPAFNVSSGIEILADVFT